MNLNWRLGYISIKQGCFVLFCFVMLNLSDHYASCHAPGIFGKLLKSRGALTWFDSVWSYGVVAIDY
jgi:hypothetical protein